MATPRSRFMRVSDLVLDEDWDDATLATVIRLLAWMRQRWAREKLTPAQAIEALIPVHEAKRITRILGRGDRALVRIESLGTRAGLTDYSSAIQRGLSSNSVWIKWPKVAEYQGWDSLESDNNEPHRRPLRRPGARLPAHGSRKNEGLEQERPPGAPGEEPDVCEGFDPARLVALLGSKDRDRALPWLVETLPQIVAAARADLATDGVEEPTRKQLRAKVLERMHAFWRFREQNGHQSPRAGPLKRFDRPPTVEEIKEAYYRQGGAR